MLRRSRAVPQGRDFSACPVRRLRVRSRLRGSGSASYYGRGGHGRVCKSPSLDVHYPAARTLTMNTAFDGCVRTIKAPPWMYSVTFSLSVAFRSSGIVVPGLNIQYPSTFVGCTPVVPAALRSSPQNATDSLLRPSIHTKLAPLSSLFDLGGLRLASRPSFAGSFIIISLYVATRIDLLRDHDLAGRAHGNA